MHDDVSPSERVKRVLFGPARDLRDRSIFHRIALVPILAWVGLGADGLSSSAYGPEEAFRTLGEHTYLAVALAVAMLITVFVIAAGYTRIIERFSAGGGGYVVATALLGRPWGVVSGCALLVDYVLTVTVSIAAANAALFSFVDPSWHAWKLPIDFLLIAGLTVLNIRGVRESVLVLTPVFAIFALTHVVLIIGGVAVRASSIPAEAVDVANGFKTGFSALGALGVLLVFLHAYSLGAGTYTGIEAVSNGLQIMREPRVRNGKRTMAYMAASLAFTASGLMLLYLLWDIRPQDGRTMNAILVERVAGDVWGGHAFVWATMLSEAALLVVAAQAGFMDGPRVLANMAVDSWFPRRFAALSERLTTQNGIVLMGVTSLAALVYTGGDIRLLVVLYAINVFITFSISMYGMLLAAIRERKTPWARRGNLPLFAVGFVLCITILCITIFEKFREGGWITIIVTGGLVALCFWTRRHYRLVREKLNQLYAQLERLPLHVNQTPPPLDPTQHTVAILVAGYGGLGIHTLMNTFRAFPGHFKNVVFLSVGLVDSAEFKSEGSIDALRKRTEEMLQKYVDLAGKLGMPAVFRYAVGTDVVDEAEQLCVQTAKEFPRITFAAGKVIFRREAWYQRLLHNETAAALQKRLHWLGHTMLILPARVQ